MYIFFHRCPDSFNTIKCQRKYIRQMSFGKTIIVIINLTMTVFHKRNHFSRHLPHLAVTLITEHVAWELKDVHWPLVHGAPRQCTAIWSSTGNSIFLLPCPHMTCGYSYLYMSEPCSAVIGYSLASMSSQQNGALSCLVSLPAWLSLLRLLLREIR